MNYWYSLIKNFIIVLVNSITTSTSDLSILSSCFKMDLSIFIPFSNSFKSFGAAMEILTAAGTIIFFHQIFMNFVIKN